MVSQKLVEICGHICVFLFFVGVWHCSSIIDCCGWCFELWKVFCVIDLFCCPIFFLTTNMLVVSIINFLLMEWFEPVISSSYHSPFTTRSILYLFYRPGMIMGASASSVWYNVRVPHPTKEVPILDYDLALLFQPMLMLGITVGVALSVVFPYWLITVLIIILFIGQCNN